MKLLLVEDEIWRANGETLRAAVVQAPSAIGPGAEPVTIAAATGIDFHLHYLQRFHTNLWILTAIACLIAIFAMKSSFRSHATSSNTVRSCTRTWKSTNAWQRW